MKAPELKVSPPIFTVLERAVIYARVSSDDRGKDGRNLQSQLEMGREYAQIKGYQILAEMPEDDRGASGADINLPQLNKIRDMARDGQFDVLIVRELDRLSRNLAKQLIIEEELRRAGVKVEYILTEYDDTPEGRLQKHIRATVAEYEREKISERMNRGRQNSIKQGNVLVNGSVPYGYKKVKENGTIRLEIVESEAQIVRLIFRWFVIGDETGKRLAVLRISKRLSEMGVLTRQDKAPRNRKKMKRGHWAGSTVNAILHNETYAGAWRHGKKTSTPLTVEVPAIISRKWWEMAQAQFLINKQNTSGNAKYNYLMGKRCTCGCCGYKMGSCSSLSSSRIYGYYRCPTMVRHDYYRECDLPLFRSDIVDETVWQWIESFLSDRTVLREKLMEYKTQVHEITLPIREQLQITENLIKEKERELRDELANLRSVSSQRAKAVIAHDIEQIERAIDGLEIQKAELTKRLEIQMPSDEQIQDIEELAAELAADLDEIKQDFESCRRLIEMLNVRATLKVEDGQKVIYAECMLGNENLLIACKNHYVDVN